jgi:hypothetical protein
MVTERDVSAKALRAMLVRREACYEAIAWAKGKSLRAAWDGCKRADWMLWLAAKLLPRKSVVRAACACARTALRYVPAGEDRPRVAIETAERWTRGEATIAEVRSAAHAASVSAYAASVSAYAAYASAVSVSVSVSVSAYAADATAYAADATGSRAKALSKMAKLVRKQITADHMVKAALLRARTRKREEP